MTNEQRTASLDRHFARLMVRLEGKPNRELELAALLVSQHRASGNICLPLAEVSGQLLPEKPLQFERAPERTAWSRALRATRMVGRPSEFKPLVLDDCDRLYLRRYWEYEDFLATAIKARVSAVRPAFEPKLLEKTLRRLFPKSASDDRQRLAAETAVRQNFTVITGGPGTGKTRTVVAILALLLEQYPPAFRIALAAPSGKAAARLKESLLRASESLFLAPEIKARMPNDASTIHRLLGAVSGSPYFRHNSEHPLLVNAIIIDEASMVDLAAMAKLLAAIPLSARVILLGDKDQLTSVEAGYVLGDICAGKDAPVRPSTSGQLSLFFEGKTQPELQGAIVELQQSYRFTETTGIYQLVTVINRGEVEKAITLLKTKTLADVTWKKLPSAQSLASRLKEIAVSGYRSFLERNDPAEALARFDNFRVLCAVRYGPYGVSAVNQLIEQSLAEVGLIKEIGPWYPGRPVLVTRNDYNLKVFNGDVGITLFDPDSPNEKRIFFSAEGQVRRVLPPRLPVHETAFAMTVHKSQGSEFDRVLLILPESGSPILTRELLYTGLTRARTQVEIWATEKALRFAIGRRVTRSSGLRDALWGSLGE